MLGNDKPRRGGSAATRRAFERVKRHAELMAAYVAQGMSRDDASRRAYLDVTMPPARKPRPAV